LEERFRGWSFEFGDGSPGTGGTHPHPVGATERAICEELIYRDIKSDFKRCKIVDIGGNANRHFFSHRKIHSCNPYLSPEDDLRYAETRYHPSADYCHNKAQDCDMIPDVYMSVHSLYYLSREDILGLLNKSTGKALYAVIHKFDNVYGGLHFNGENYESKYQVSFDKKEPLVTMEVNGNMSPYTHSAMLWIDDLHYHNHEFGMSWNGRKVGDSWLMKFILTDRKYAYVERKCLTLVDSIRRTDHYGAVSGILNLNDTESMMPTLKTFEIDDVEIRSLYKFVWLTHNRGSKKKILIPKGLIQTVAAKMVGVERNPKSLKICIKFMQSYVSADKLNMPPEIVLNCKTFGAALAFVYSLDKELVAFNNLCSHSMHGRYSSHLNVLNLIPLYSVKRVQNATIAGFGTTAVLAASKWLKTGNPHMGGPKGTLLVGTAMAAVIGYYYYKVDDANPTPELETVTEYAVTRSSRPSSNFEALTAWPKGLVGYTSNKILKPLRKGAVVNPGPQEHKDEKNEFYVVAPVFSDYIPLVSSANAQNELRAVVNRACMQVPNPDDNEWEEVYKSSEFYINLFKPIEENYEETFILWNSKFPAGRQKQHNEALESLILHPMNKKDLVRAAFVKRELIMKGGFEAEEFDPRCIQGVSHRANVRLGPFIYAFTKMYKSIFTIDTEICYTGGYTAEELGGWRGQFGDEDVTIIEIDFSRYDAHQARQCHGLEKRFYVRSGINDWPEARLVFDGQGNTVGFTANGVYFALPYTRKSGDPNTSVGNSTINSMIANYIFRVKLGFDYKMLVQGDDNLLVLRGTFSKAEVESMKHVIINIYVKLGFEVKLKIANRWHEVEFCSSVFWPASDGYVLGPKIGRRLPKMGFSLKQLRPGEVKGMLLGAVKEMNHIPVLRVYVRHVLGLLENVEKEVYNEVGNPYRVKCSSKHSSCDATKEFFRNRYGIDSDVMESSLKEQLNTIESLTTVFSWDLLNQLLDIDL
jgi:hypothetical protein